MNEAPKLAPPGAGIPFIERIFGRYVFLPRAQKKGWTEAIDAFAKESQRVLAIVEPLTAEARGKKVLIDHLPGLEDSSRYWSVAETVEHLEITGMGIVMIASELTAGRSPNLEVDTAKVKPRNEVAPAEAAMSFRKFAEGAERVLRQLPDGRSSRAKHPHPWFGPLTAHGWLCLLGIHQRLHRQQMEAIVRGLPS
jgi:hypothetical protein